MSRGETAHEADEARTMIRALVADHPAGQEAALVLVASQVGLSKWSAYGLLRGRWKSVGYTTLTALRRQYEKYLERQIAKLEAEMNLLRAERCGDAGVTALGEEVARVVGKIRQARRQSG